MASWRPIFSIISATPRLYLYFNHSGTVHTLTNTRRDIDFETCLKAPRRPLSLSTTIKCQSAIFFVHPNVLTTCHLAHTCINLGVYFVILSSYWLFVYSYVSSLWLCVAISLICPHWIQWHCLLRRLRHLLVTVLGLFNVTVWIGIPVCFDDCIHLLSVVYLFVQNAVRFASPFLAYTGLTVRTANWSAVQRLLYNNAAGVPHHEQRGAALVRCSG